MASEPPVLSLNIVDEDKASRLQTRVPVPVFFDRYRGERRSERYCGVWFVGPRGEEAVIEPQSRVDSPQELWSRILRNRRELDGRALLATCASDPSGLFIEPADDHDVREVLARTFGSRQIVDLSLVFNRFARLHVTLIPEGSNLGPLGGIVSYYGLEIQPWA